jgi:hypothetical protein
MSVPEPECGRAAHRVVHRATRRLGVMASFGPLASGGALLVACIEQGPLFAEYLVEGPENAGAGGGNDVPEPSPPPLDSMGGSAGAAEPDDVLPPDACAAPLDAGTESSACAALANEACLACLSSECPDVIQTCRDTPGCDAISACAQSTGCLDDECYCGTVTPLVCGTTGEGNGPCRHVVLAAPESREPSALNPTAGPAAEAARPVGTCRRESVNCADLCGG